LAGRREGEFLNRHDAWPCREPATGLFFQRGLAFCANSVVKIF
jgi:hypothetical protein